MKLFSVNKVTTSSLIAQRINQFLIALLFGAFFIPSAFAAITGISGSTSNATMALSPSFTAGTTSYTATVPYGTSTMSLTVNSGSGSHITVSIGGVVINDQNNASSPAPMWIGNVSVTNGTVIQITDNGLNTPTYSLTVAIASQLTATSNTTAQVYTVGTPVNFTPIQGSGGFGSLSYSSGPLPAGLSLNHNTGVVAGTPTAVSTSTNVSFRVMDSTGPAGAITATVNITVNAASSDPTPTLTFATPTSASVAMGSTLTDTATSSITSGAGAITYSSATTSVATVNANTGVVTPVAVGTSVITATQAAVTGVNAVATATYTVTVNLATQATLTANSSSASIVPTTGTSTLSTTGGSGTGAVTYAVTSGSCTVSGATLTAGSSTGTCTVTATKAADSTYASTTTTVNVTVANLVAQTTLTALASPASIRVNATSTLSTTGGSGTGAVTYAVTSGSCTISGTTLTAPASAGTCTVTATKAADSTYASTTATVNVTVNGLSAQAALVVSASPTAISKNTGTSTLSATGGSGAGAVSYAVTTGSCSVSGVTLTAGSVGETCTVTATRAADANYMSVTGTVNITVNNRASIADAVNQTVIGTVTAQATVAQRFVDAQVNNIASHIQGLRNSFDVKTNRVAIGISSPELSQASPVLQKLSETISAQTNQAMAETETLKQAYSKDAIEELVQKLNDARNSGNLAQVLSLYAGADHAKVKSSLQGLKVGQGESKVISIRALGANEFVVRVERTWSAGKAIVPVAIQINKDGQYELRYSEVELVKSIQASNTDLYGASGKAIIVKATANTQLAQANVPSKTDQPINQELFGDAPFGIWASGNLDYGHMTVSGGANKFGTQGLTFGVDLQVEKNLIVGAALGYGFDKTDIDSMGSNVKSDQVSFTAYGIYQPAKDWFVDGLFGYGNLNMNNNRYSSAASSIFSADRKGETVYGSFGVGNIMKFDDMKVQPYARAAYTSTTLNSYTEGTDTNALGYDKAKLISGSVSAGLLMSEDFSVEGGKITPSAKIEAKRNARGTLNQGIYYADTPSENTVLSMTPAPQNVQSFGLGVVYTEKSHGASLGLNWLGSIGSNSYRANAVKADVRVPF